MSSSVSSSTGFSAIVPSIPRDGWFAMFSRVEYPDFVRFTATCKSTKTLREQDGNYFERVLYFADVPIFDCNKWKVCWNAEITDKYDGNKIEIRTLRAFLAFYWGPMPAKIMKEGEKGRVKDHCLNPAVIPTTVTVEEKESKHCLNVLEDRAKTPQEGYHAAKFMSQTEALKQNGAVGLEEACLVVVLKGVVARNKPWSNNSEDPTKRGQVQFLEELNEETGCGFETEPEAVVQNTTLFAHHAVTGERPFGDGTGMEGRVTYGRTREPVRYGTQASQMTSGCFEAGKALDPLGASAPAELNIGDVYFDHEYAGVGVLRKF